MFAGAGDFFRPVDLRKEVSPASAVKPLSSGGEYLQKHKSTAPQDESAEDAVQSADAPEEFSDDAISLSLPALFMMLTGAPPSPLQAESPEKAGALACNALGAYQRAAEILPAAPTPTASGDTGVGTEIFQMLAALEKSGVAAVTVRSGQTIYEALRAQCRVHDIALAVPSAGPDNIS